MKMNIHKMKLNLNEIGTEYIIKEINLAPFQQPYLGGFSVRIKENKEECSQKLIISCWVHQLENKINPT